MRSLLIFTENYARGGGNRYMIDMANALAMDYEQEFLVSNGGGIFSEDTDRLSHPVVKSEVPFISRPRINNFISNSPKRLRQIISISLVIFEPLFLIINIVLFIRLISQLRPAVVLSCNGGYPAAHACLAMSIAGRITQVPVALSIVSMPARRRLFTWCYERILDSLVWGSASVVVVNAKCIAAALCEFRGAPLQKIKVVYNGLEDKQPDINQQVEKKGQLVLGCLARMDRAKGVLLLFEAFVRLANDHPEMQLVMAGQGDASAELERRTEILGLQNRVHLLGHYQGDVGALLASFDIFVFPSLWEGFPYSIVEALRSGCVIVASRVGGIPEAVADGVEGLLVEPRSSDEIVTTIERLVNDREMRRTLGKNARSKFERELMLPKMQMRFREVFAGLKGREAQWG